MPTINTFTDYAAEQQDIERRRKMAEMLQAQALQPIEQQTAGGYVTPISWTQGLAKVLQGGMGAFQGRQATNEASDLAKRYTQERSGVLNDAIRAGSAMPKRRRCR